MARVTNVESKVEQLHSGRWVAEVSWWQDPPPEPISNERPVYQGSESNLGTFDTKADAEAAVARKIEELQR